MSYTALKDVWGTVGKFHEHLEVELKKKTGDRDLVFFRDKSAIHAGDAFEKVIFDALDSAKLLLVLLSPTWLSSDWCKREYKLFREGSQRKGTNRPIVPVMWDRVSAEDAAHREEKKILAELSQLQIFEWNDLQYADWTSPELSGDRNS
ncbi:toll/interleukin-1 receptor domain-containing protein [Pyxidicoccus parkwayensis]|uniref:Toll/interleukin-1 receptor domain-containing protein n=1 Tax=Pyxidicoccus parkwayensis TaxID=2813578 RepID=A0ABX7P324_9BACT|nr:toll/interleukin-1 receptor domain-containing protein [Pyxidicoccus parkwaysis]QSQ24879.1 toll/interleukin-1 receptor domain-containing protein [Pyxidicoccus parkwaysis]